VPGVLSYLAIFALSTPLTEAISASKYDQYKEYQRLVGRFVPGVSRSGVTFGAVSAMQRWFDKQVVEAQKLEKKEKAKSVKAKTSRKSQ